MEIFPAVELNFGTTEGRLYQIQASDDLETWSDWQGVFEGQGGRTTVFVSVYGTRMRYFRLVESDVGKGGSSEGFKF